MKNIFLQVSVFLFFCMTLNIAFGGGSHFDERLTLLEEVFGSLNESQQVKDLYKELSVMQDITDVKMISNKVTKQNCLLIKMKYNEFDTMYEDMMQAGRHRSNINEFDTMYEDMMQAGRHRSNINEFDTMYEDMMQAGRHRSNINEFDTMYEDMMQAGRHRSNINEFDTVYEDMMQAGRHRSNINEFDTMYEDMMQAGRHRSNINEFVVNGEMNSMNDYTIYCK